MIVFERTAWLHLAAFSCPPRGQPTGWGVAPGGARPPWASSIPKLASQARPISENVWVYVPTLHTGLPRSTSPASRGGRPKAAAVALIQRQGLQLELPGLSTTAHRCAAAAGQAQPQRHRAESSELRLSQRTG